MYSEIYREIDQVIEKQQAAALCVVVRASGSTPRGKGSKMLVYPDGHFSGTVGGGELEQRVIAVAQDVITSYSIHYTKLYDNGNFLYFVHIIFYSVPPFIKVRSHF